MKKKLYKHQYHIIMGNYETIMFTNLLFFPWYNNKEDINVFQTAAYYLLKSIKEDNE